MKIVVLFLALLFVRSSISAQVPVPSAAPDARFKADLLVVIAHPDDESAIGAYLAKAVFDEHKRVAVVYGTRGNGGGNAIGQEQAAALGSIREIEGRRALAYLGISSVWFLDGPDTPGQDVLRSLETWDHGRSLDRLVRLVRLTRPSVIATWLPAYSAGENHGDHQAAGVMATEAFDLAGDPTQYPEQVTPPRDPRDIGNLTEGLHPWQAQKLYYFSDASHTDFQKGKGPEYSAIAISPSKKKSYARLSAEQCSFHLTQSDSGYAAAVFLEKNTVDKSYFAEPSRFIFGKSHVDSGTTGDLFEAVRSEPVPYRAAPGFSPATSSTPALELGGPWHFYKQFWAAHGLTSLSNLLPPEIEASASTRISLPVLISNPGSEHLAGEIKLSLPPGWSLPQASMNFDVDGTDVGAFRFVAVAPASVNSDWKDITLTASSGGKEIGSVRIRARVIAAGSLPN